MDEGVRYILWGSGGHAKVLASLIRLSGAEVSALFDNNPDVIAALSEVPLYIGKDGFSRWSKEEPNRRNLYGLAAIGGAKGRVRLAIHDLFQANGVRVKPLIHPQASVCPTASLGVGTQVLAKAVIAADANLGEGCIVNHRAGVDHECVLGDGVHLAPGATLCGCVNVGSNVFIGAGAVVLPRVVIGEDTIVGAGSVVLDDLPGRVVAFGNPARVIRSASPTQGERDFEVTGGINERL